MTFNEFNTAIDTVMEMCNVSDDVAIETVSKICNIFSLTPSESGEELKDLFINLLVK